MSIQLAILLLVVGAIIGLVGGMVGIGGGILVIPTLIIGFGFTQARANGTSLAMLLPPIGILAVVAYARAGNVDWRFAGLLALGFTFGAYAGARLVTNGMVHPTALRVLFSAMLLFVVGRLLFRSGGQARAALETVLMMIGVLGTYGLMRLIGRHWSRPRANWAAIYRAKRQTPLQYDYEI